MPHGGMGTVTTRTSEAYYLIGDVLICIICSDLNSDLNTNLKARGGGGVCSYPQKKIISHYSEPENFSFSSQ